MYIEYIMPSLTIEEVKQYSPFATSIFVETGTYEGGTVNTVKSNFEKVFSIELDEKYANRAIERFKNDSNVYIINGDSTHFLKPICGSLTSPTFFYFSRIYCQNYPICWPLIYNAVKN
jgi:16S rRNA A1518/A1519 N6-dimethyltransferase RsmA/KsgA/DIM1 with predicted DNA glycosylase/AP lyase activity